jgi:hypothetical protein
MRPPVEKQNGSAIPWPRSLARNNGAAHLRPRWPGVFPRRPRMASRTAQDGLLWTAQEEGPWAPWSPLPHLETSSPEPPNRPMAQQRNLPGAAG